jgi:hypothetical protein
MVASGTFRNFNLCPPSQNLPKKKARLPPVSSFETPAQHDSSSPKRLISREISRSILDQPFLGRHYNHVLAVRASGKWAGVGRYHFERRCLHSRSVLVISYSEIVQVFDLPPICLTYFNQVVEIGQVIRHRPSANYCAWQAGIWI